MEVEDDTYDRHAAYVLAAASAWAYGDSDSLARLLAHRGIANECVAVEFRNDALLVDSTAYLVQSEDRRLALLCFRGTGPRNLINWLTDVNVAPETLPSVGNVHGGFYRTTAALWPLIRDLLHAAARGESVCRALEIDQQMRGCPSPGSPEGGGAQRPGQDGPRGDGLQTPTEQGPSPSGRLEALYITGHSLGGAMAVLAAALLHSDRQTAALRSLLRGVYVYGAPMVGGRAFARHFGEVFGKKLFRHVYGMDIVPRLPPLTTGRYAQFGQEYTSTSSGWAEQERPVTQALKISVSLAIGLVSLLRDKLPGLSWLRLPITLRDHSLLRYLRTSQIAALGTEFD